MLEMSSVSTLIANKYIMPYMSIEICTKTNTITHNQWFYLHKQNTNINSNSATPHHTISIPPEQRLTPFPESSW